MVKVEMVSHSNFDIFTNDLLNVLAEFSKKHGDDSIVSISHTVPCAETPKCIALVTYKTKS